MQSEKYIVGLITPEALASLKTDGGFTAKAIEACDALEIRYDLFPDEAAWPRLSETVSDFAPEKLQIGTLRLARDGGNLPNSRASSRLRNWELILSQSEHPAVLDLEQDCLFAFAELNLLAKEAHAEILVSQHDFHAVPLYQTLEKLATDALRLGATGVKIAAMSNSHGDTAPLYNFAEAYSAKFRYFSAFAMGETGKASRLLSLKKGSNLSYASISQASAPGQLPALKMRQILDFLPENATELQVFKLLQANSAGLL